MCDCDRNSRTGIICNCGRNSSRETACNCNRCRNTIEVTGSVVPNNNNSRCGRFFGSYRR